MFTKQAAFVFLYSIFSYAQLFSQPPTPSNESKKVVLLEQFTGAWCGWCVEGTSIANDLEKEFGNRFIGVKIHQGDGMQNNAIWPQMDSLVEGFPSAGIDRANFSGSTVLYREKWRKAVEQRLNTEPYVDVQVKRLSYEPKTRTATITVTSKLLKDVSGELRFNLYIVEDSISGSGSNYEQQNFFSGNSNYKDHEFYTKPRVLEGYQHMSVLRDMLGGVYGHPNSFPAEVSIDSTYEYTFTYILPENYKAWHTKAVVTVYNYKSKKDMLQNEILNATESGVFSSPPTNESRRVVLLEQYTGAWSGWCVDGTIVMNDIEKEFGDRFIGVNIHRDDAMQNDSIWSQVDSLVIGLPSASIDKTNIEGSTLIDRGTWRKVVKQRLDIEPSVNVHIKEMIYDPSTRTASITVSTKILKQVSGNLRFNLYIIEDSVSGTGSGYDQQNFYSENSNYQNHEYFSKPRVLEGYQHMSVVRDILGGVYGQPGSFPSELSVDSSYDYTFTYFLPADYKAWHTKAVVSVYNYRNNSDVLQNEILNAAESGTFSMLPKYQVMGLAANFGFIEQSGMISGNDMSSKSISFNNISDEPVTLNLVISNKTVLPSQWNVSLNENTLTVPAKSSKEITVNVKSNSFAACQPIEVTAIPVKDSMQGVPKTSTFWVLSENARAGIFHGLTSDILAKSSMTALQNVPNFERVSVFIPLNHQTIKGFDLGKLDIGVFDLGKSVLDMPETGGTALDAINQLLDNNKKVYITGERLLTNNKDEKIRTQDCVDFFEKKLGVSLNQMKQRISGQALLSFEIYGIKNDPIGNGLEIEGNTSTTIESLAYTSFTESVNLLPHSKSIPILYFDNNLKEIAGIRFEDGAQRIVYLGFNPICIANTTIRERLLSNAYNWLMNGSATSAEDLDNALANAFATPNPISGSNVTLSFDATVDGTSTFSVMNTLGQNVMTFDGNVQNGKNNVNLNVNNLTSGSYTVSAVIGGRTLRIPFIVTK